MYKQQVKGAKRAIKPKLPKMYNLRELAKHPDELGIQKNLRHDDSGECCSYSKHRFIIDSHAAFSDSFVFSPFSGF